MDYVITKKNACLKNYSIPITTRFFTLMEDMIPVLHPNYCVEKFSCNFFKEELIA
jgi:hypothetical protein